jgi:enoyl-CoA hydratase
VSTRLLAAPKESILLLTLESDDGYPRLERGVLADISRQIERLARARELAGAVITGTERAFAAGAEIEELARLSPPQAWEFAREGQSVLRQIEVLGKPVIAGIRGYCMGGGLDLALACDRRIAAPDAVFAHPGGSLGILTGWGGTQRLPRLVGRGRALDLMVTGRRINAPEAADWGLISKIVPAADVIPEAIRIACEL